MDIAKALDIVFVGVHPQAVTVDQGRFLLDLYMMDECSNSSSGIDLFGMVDLVIEDFYDLDRVAAGGMEYHLPLQLRGQGEQDAKAEYPDCTGR
jgi:hypothetical protein